MANYKHGIHIVENPTSVPSPVKSEAGIPVIFGTAPIYQLENPDDAVNKVFLCNTFAEAKEALGYSNNYKAYTLCEAMDAFFRAYGVGPVALVNVLGSTGAATKTVTATVTNGQIVITDHIIMSQATLKAGEATLAKDTDYILEFDDEGNAVVSFISDKATEGASISVSGKALASETAKCGVTANTIIGSYSAATGVATGIELIREVWPKTGYVPGLLLAPGYSDASVGAALAAKCTEINGLFTCECVFDLDASLAPVADSIKTAKSAFINKHMIVVYPKVVYNGQAMDYSAMYAAMVAYTDYNNDNVPNLSPSNKPMPITAVVDNTEKEIVLDMLQANELNALGIVTALNINGAFRAWGNNTAAYPSNTDPKDRWICCRRFFSWWGNNFVTNFFDKVDDPSNYRLIESIVDAENVRGNALVSAGKCAGARMEYRKEDNYISDILDGKLTFRQYLAPYTPAEYITDILEFDPDMLEAALSGGEA